MLYIAIAAGLIVGWIYSRHGVDHLFFILYLGKYKDEGAFLSCYDLADDEVSYEFFKDYDKELTSYAKYLHLHRDARVTAYKTFLDYYQPVTKSLMLTTIYALAPAILFWKWSYGYMVGFFLVAVLVTMQRLLVKQNWSAFFSRVMINTVLSQYLSQKIHKSELID